MQHSECWRAAVVRANKCRAGVPLSEEHKQKIRLACNTLEMRARISAARRLKGGSAFKGKTHTDEAKAKQSAAKRGKILTEEHKAKIGASCRNLGEGWKAKLRLRPGHSWGNSWGKKNKGKSLTVEQRAKVSAGLKRFWQSDERNVQARERRAHLTAAQMQRWPKPKTILEKKLAKYLEEHGWAYEEQKGFGRYIVDAYVPSLNIAFEADGSFWHKDKERQRLRDAYLIAHGIITVVHFTEDDLLQPLAGIAIVPATC